MAAGYGLIAWHHCRTLRLHLADTARALQPVHRSRLRLENDFFGPAKRLQRVKASRGLLAGNTLEAEPILDFFETVALLLRRGALDKEIVRHTFFYWIDRYYQAAEAVIAARQEIGPLVWKDLTGVVETMRKPKAAEMRPTLYSNPSPDEITRFLEEELSEAT